MAARGKQTIATYGRRGHRVVAVEDDLWLKLTDSTSKIKEPKLFSSLSSNDSALSSSALSENNSAERKRNQLKRYPKDRLKLKRGNTKANKKKSGKENTSPCTPSLSMKQPIHTYSLRKTGKKKTGSCSSTGSEGIFESVTKKEKRFDRRVLQDKNTSDISTTPEINYKKQTAKTGQKKPAATGIKKTLKAGPIEKSRKAVQGNCPSFNFSDFDSFDLVVETSSESKAKIGTMEDHSMLSHTPVSSHIGNQKTNAYRPVLTQTPQVPEIPKVNLYAANAFSTSITSLPNSPTIDAFVTGNREGDTGYIHTSSPRVDSGFEADRSQSYDSSTDRCRLSHVNSTPLADLSAISNVSEEQSILHNTSVDVPHMPSIDENSVSDFSHLQGTNQSCNALNTASPASHQESPLQMSTCDPSVNKQLGDMAKLTEQLSLMSTEGNSKHQESLATHQTPRQYYTRQFAKSTQKLAKNKFYNVSRASSNTQHSILGRVATRNAAKSIRSEMSYDASRSLFENEGSDGEQSDASSTYESDEDQYESPDEDQYESQSATESSENEDGDVESATDSEQSEASEEHSLAVIEEDEESAEEVFNEDDTNSESDQYHSANSEMDSGTRYMLACNPPSTYDSRTPPEQLSTGRITIDPSFSTPLKDIITELNRENKNLKVVLTPVKLSRSGIVPSARDKVLWQCDQTDYCAFTDVFSAQMLKKCVKIGEGVFGEVFRTERRNQSVALKVIPIEGDFPVNDEPQKSFEEILPEIVISKEVSALSSSSLNSTQNFVQVKRVSVVQGSYPDVLLEQWDSYHTRNVSENDRPDVFNDNQLFLVFEFEDAGAALESFMFETLEEGKCILHQVALSLAIGEKELEFEHRDLHIGNVLVKRVKNKDHTLEYTMDGKTLKLDSCGVKASIIDFTLSRLHKDGCTLFTDLSADPTLFTGQGDYQFEVYRLMKNKNGNEWKTHQPYTNVLWIHYTADKLLNATRYENKSSKEHKSLVREFRAFLREALEYDSAHDLVTNCMFFNEE